MPEEKIEIGFKVVWAEMGRCPVRVTPLVTTYKLNFYSLINNGGVEYAIGTLFTFPQPQNGPLAIFNTLSNAIQFVLTCGMAIDCIRIFESEYIPSNEKALWIKYGNEVKTYSPLDMLPQGTILAKCIRLIKIVECEQLEKIRKPF